MALALSNKCAKKFGKRSYSSTYRRKRGHIFYSDSVYSFSHKQKNTV